MENFLHNVFMDFYFVPMELINSLFSCKRSEYENGRNYLGKNSCISCARNAHFENYYGTPRAQAEEKMEKGSVLLDIEPNGAKQVKAAAPEAVLIFIMPPSLEELERRLRGRGDTPEEQIVIRMERATWEMEQRHWYDHVVVNDDAERCAEEILNIIAE